jgi:benzoyl-CoA reductase subunit B
MAETHDIVGRGNRDGAQLFQNWFNELNRTADRGGPAAYVFVMGSLAELLRVFDLPIVMPEINSLQTAVRRVAHEYLNQAEDYGYSPDICGYVKADRGPAGAANIQWVAFPNLAAVRPMRNTYIKWAEIWKRTADSHCYARRSGTRAGGKQTWLRDPISTMMPYVLAQTES